MKTHLSCVFSSAILKTERTQITAHFSISFLGSSKQLLQRKIQSEGSVAWPAEHTMTTLDQSERPQWPQHALWLMLISSHQMLQHVLMMKVYNEVTRQQVNVQKTVDLIIAFFTPVFVLEVWNTVRHISAKCMLDTQLAFIQMKWNRIE